MSVTEIRPRVWDGVRAVERGYPVILPICHKCRLFYRCTSCLPSPTLLFLPLLFASEIIMLHSGRRTLPTAVWLRLRQQPAAGSVSGYRYRVSQSKKYRPIPDPPQYRPVLANTRYPNTSIVRTLGTWQRFESDAQGVIHEGRLHWGRQWDQASCRRTKAHKGGEEFQWKQTSALIHVGIWLRSEHW